MIKETELRIGCNYQLKHGVLGGGTCRISNVTDFVMAIDLLKNGALFGIPLTEDWLINFGFSKINDFDCYENIWQFKGFMVTLGDYVNTHVDWVEEADNYYPSIVCYEELFVHTLQNLYFALTNEELQHKKSAST